MKHTLILILSLLVVGAYSQTKMYKIPYTVVNKSEKKLERIDVGFFVELNSGRPVSGVKEDDLAYQILDLIELKDTSQLQKLCASSPEKCAQMLDQLSVAYKDFFNKNPSIVRKDRIKNTLFYTIENDKDESISIRLHKDETSDMWKWTLDMPADILDFKISTSLEEKVTTPGDTEGKKFNRWMLTKNQVTNTPCFLARIHKGTSVSDLNNIKDYDQYESIFGEALSRYFEAKRNEPKPKFITTEKYNADALSLEKNLSQALENEDRYFAILDADPLYIFWIPEDRELGGDIHSFTCVYEIYRKENQFILNDRESLIQQITHRILEDGCEAPK